MNILPLAMLSLAAPSLGRRRDTRAVFVTGAAKASGALGRSPFPEEGVSVTS